jgi:hypothetical protein
MAQVSKFCFNQLGNPLGLITAGGYTILRSPPTSYGTTIGKSTARSVQDFLMRCILKLLQDFIYDDFIPQFTAVKFNASAWVDLFATAGARYFVLVTVRSLLSVTFFKSDLSESRLWLETPRWIFAVRYGYYYAPK